MIVSAKLFQKGETIGIGASGGKDSTVLAHVLKVLNDRYNYGLNLMLLSVDEGISGYRDDSLETVKRNQQQYDLPLKIISYEELYGWTMDQIVRKVGLKNNCTFCGVFRRQALDRGAMMLKVDKVCTGKALITSYIPTSMRFEWFQNICWDFDPVPLNKYISPISTPLIFLMRF